MWITVLKIVLWGVKSLVLGCKLYFTLNYYENCPLVEINLFIVTFIKFTDSKTGNTSP